MTKDKLHKQLIFEIPRAKFGQEYYVIATNFRVRKNVELNDEYDNIQHRTKNYFLDKSQAIKFAMRLQDELICLWKEEMEKK